MIKFLDSCMAFLLGLAIGAAISMFLFPALPIAFSYCCLGGLIAVEYWQYRYIQDELEAEMDLLLLKSEWDTNI